MGNLCMLSNLFLYLITFSVLCISTRKHRCSEFSKSETWIRGKYFYIFVTSGEIEDLHYGLPFGTKIIFGSHCSFNFKRKCSSVVNQFVFFADATRERLRQGGRPEEFGQARAGQWPRQGSNLQIAPAVLQSRLHRHLGPVQVSLPQPLLPSFNGLAWPRNRGLWLRWARSVYIMFERALGLVDCLLFVSYLHTRLDFL